MPYSDLEILQRCNDRLRHPVRSSRIREAYDDCFYWDNAGRFKNARRFTNQIPEFREIVIKMHKRIDLVIELCRIGFGTFYDVNEVLKRRHMTLSEFKHLDYVYSIRYDIELIKCAAHKCDDDVLEFIYSKLQFTSSDLENCASENTAESYRVAKLAIGKVEQTDKFQVLAKANSWVIGGIISNIDQALDSVEMLREAYAYLTPTKVDLIVAHFKNFQHISLEVQAELLTLAFAPPNIGIVDFEMAIKTQIPEVIEWVHDLVQPSKQDIRVLIGHYSQYIGPTTMMQLTHLLSK